MIAGNAGQHLNDHGVTPLRSTKTMRSCFGAGGGILGTGGAGAELTSEECEAKSLPSNHI